VTLSAGFAHQRVTLRTRDWISRHIRAYYALKFGLWRALDEEGREGADLVDYFGGGVEVVLEHY